MSRILSFWFSRNLLLRLHVKENSAKGQRLYLSGQTWILCAILTWGLGGCCTTVGWLAGSSFFLLPARSHSWSFFMTRGESVRRNMPERGPRAASSVSRTRSRRADGSCRSDVNLTVDRESPSESSPSRWRMNRLLYRDLFLGTSYSGASYLTHNRPRRSIRFPSTTRNRTLGPDPSTSSIPPTTPPTIRFRGSSINYTSAPE